MGLFRWFKGLFRKEKKVQIKNGSTIHLHGKLKKFAGSDVVVAGDKKIEYTEDGTPIVTYILKKKQPDTDKK